MVACVTERVRVHRQKQVRVEAQQVQRRAGQLLPAIRSEKAYSSRHRPSSAEQGDFALHAARIFRLGVFAVSDVY
jgi:hypothetical protein